MHKPLITYGILLHRYVTQSYSAKMASRLREKNVVLYNYAQVSYIMGGVKAAQIQLRKVTHFFSAADANI